MARNSVERKLIAYLQDAQAMERSISMMLNSMIFSTRDERLVEELRRHKAETETHERRLSERLRELGSGASASKQATALAPTLLKGMLDQFRSDKPAQNARDGFVTEQLEIAVYELLERLALRAGDADSAEVARANRADEERMAAFFAANWDMVVDLTLGARAGSRGTAPRRARSRANARPARARARSQRTRAAAAATPSRPRRASGSGARRRPRSAAAGAAAPAPNSDSSS